MAFLFKRSRWWLALLLIPGHAFAMDETQVASPDGSVQVKVIFKDSLRYEVSFKNQPVIEPSTLSFTLDGVELAAQAGAGEIKTYRLNETYHWRGDHAQATNNCNGATIALQHGGVGYTLEVRAFNDGAGYRFIVPGDGKARVPDENSQFVIPAGSRVW